MSWAIDDPVAADGCIHSEGHMWLDWEGGEYCAWGDARRSFLDYETYRKSIAQEHETNRRNFREAMPLNEVWRKRPDGGREIVPPGEPTNGMEAWDFNAY